MTTLNEEQRFEAYVNMIERKVNRTLSDEERSKIRFISEIEADDEFAHIYEATTDMSLEDEQ